MILKTITSKIISMLSLALCISLIASTSIAATYYVDKGHSNASDTNSGTEVMPFKTIQQGVNKAVAGDNVYVKSGTYSEKVTIKNSGTASKPITIMAYPGDLPIIDGTGISLSSYYGLVHIDNKDYIIFDGFHVRNSKEVLIRASYGTGIIIRNCMAHTNFASGTDGVFLSHVTNSFVDNNEIYDSRWNALNIESSTNTKVRNNYIHDNVLHAGINIFPKTSEEQKPYSGNDIIGNIVTGIAPDAAIYMRYQTDNIIANNLVYGNAGDAIRLDVDRCSSGIGQCKYVFRSNTEFYNNTIVGNGRWAISIDNATHTKIKNNIIDSNNSGAIYISSKANSGHTIDYNNYYGKDFSSKGSNGLYANPLFKDKANNDYTLTSQSPALNKGEDLTSRGITEDILGAPRPQGNGFDIGAFEFGSGPYGTPAAPKNVHIVSN